MIALAGALLVGAVMASGSEEPDAVSEVPEPASEVPEPISAEPLTQRAEFTDDVAMKIRNRFDGQGTDVMNLRDASRAAVVEITIQPGAVFPWHTHPCPVLINTAEGDFVYVLAEDCVERDYTAGQALIDAGGENVHPAYNPQRRGRDRGRRHLPRRTGEGRAHHPRRRPGPRRVPPAHAIAGVDRRPRGSRPVGPPRRARTTRAETARVALGPSRQVSS